MGSYPCAQWFHCEFLTVSYPLCCLVLPLHFPVRFLYNRPTEIFYFILSSDNLTVTLICISLLFLKFLLKYSLFTILCQFQVYSKVIPFCIHMYVFQIILHYRLFQDSDHSSLCYTVGLVVYLFYIQCCVYVHPKFQIYTSPLTFPLW